MDKVDEEADGADLRPIKRKRVKIEKKVLTLFHNMSGMLQKQKKKRHIKCEARAATPFLKPNIIKV